MNNLINFRTNKENIIASISDIKFKIFDNKQEVHLIKNNKDRGILIDFLGISDEYLFNYLENHAEQVEFVD